jgi:hypothetical protein
LKTALDFLPREHRTPKTSAGNEAISRNGVVGLGAGTAVLEPGPAGLWAEPGLWTGVASHCVGSVRPGDRYAGLGIGREGEAPWMVPRCAPAQSPVFAEPAGGGAGVAGPGAGCPVWAGLPSLVPAS